ncbi:MAG: virulence protein RhuM/Fic/DOC family protein [Burkholderiales bacterium]|nr:virulence protein RhuM/Fic/DOC family protein [Burkholderiales bacterium]
MTIPHGEVKVFEAADGSLSVDVRLEGESVWLTQKQMAELFGKHVMTVNSHISNVFAESELSQDSTIRKFLIVQKEGKREVEREVEHYNLDVIISVGYRVKSKRGTQFRMWATKTLKEHLVQGYTVNARRLAENCSELDAALTLVRRTADAQQLTLDQGRGLVDVITRYTRTYLLLQQYDEGSLTEPKGKQPAYTLTTDAARFEISRLQADLAGRREITALFGQERGDALDSLLGNLEQTVLGDAAYPTVESKAAHLLYFVIKDHPLSDGNKRVASCLFLHFLERNNALLRSDGTPKLNDVGMAALALLVAESNPASKETVVRLIMNLLAEPAS